MDRLRFILGLFVVLLVSCDQGKIDNMIKPPNEQHFADYWYQGKAELNTFSLEQARYGEMRQGQAVMIFVTEPFSIKNRAKSNEPTAADPVVMKLNYTRKFATGIYPYSMMTSVFYPVNSDEHALKVSTSIQEWCGHVYLELNKESKYEVALSSYFEGESFDNKFDVVPLEDEIFTQIRINPSTLPTGDFEMIPSFSFIRLKHVEFKAYACSAELKESSDINTYSVNYPEIERKVEIFFKSEFPYAITGWKETYRSGFGRDAPLMTTEGKLEQRIMIDYWKKNTVADSTYRNKLQIQNF